MRRNNAKENFWKTCNLWLACAHLHIISSFSLGESIKIGDNIAITIRSVKSLDANNKEAAISIEAPGISVLRAEAAKPMQHAANPNRNSTNPSPLSPRV